MESEDFGDYEYDIVPMGYGDMAYDITPALDEFGIGYGDLGAPPPPPPPTGRKNLKRRLKKLTKRRRFLLMALGNPFIRSNPIRRRRLKKRLRKVNRKIKMIRKRMRARLRPPAPPRPGLRFARIVPKVTDYRKIKPSVRQYSPITAGAKYRPIKPQIQTFKPILPQVRQYAPMASEEGAEESPVVRIRQTAPPAEEYEEEFEDTSVLGPDEDFSEEEEEYEDMDGYGMAFVPGKLFGGRFKGVVATTRNYKKMRREYFAYRRRWKKWKKKSNTATGKSIANNTYRTMRKYYGKARLIEKKNAYQVRRAGGWVRARPAAQKLYQYIKKVGSIKRSPWWKKKSSVRKPPPPPFLKAILPPPPPPPGSAAPPPPPPKMNFRQWKAWVKRTRGWRTPPADFLSRSKRGRYRWEMWNGRSSTALRLKRLYWASKQKRQLPYPIYRPAPRPIPRYRPFRPYVSPYAPIPMPGPSFAPIMPPMQQYAPAPMPVPRTYAPVTGLERPTSYTYTTAQRQQQAVAQQAASRANVQAQQAQDQAFEAGEEEKQGNSLMTLGLGVAAVAGLGWFLSNRKKAKKKTKKKTSTAPARAF